MDTIQKNNYENLQNNFDTLWAKFTDIFPIAKEIIKSKEIDKIRMRYAEKYKNLCDSNVDVIKSSCLLERFISTFNSTQQAESFKSEITGITSALKKALKYSYTEETLTNKIKDIAKNMIITLDTNPFSENNDYRNRLNEILIYNWLSECENIMVSFIEKDLGNGKKCDFVCQHIDDGSILLFDVYSINNLKIEKQDDSKTFSDFINQKVKKKYEEKTQNLSTLPNLKIIPILKYTEGLESFRITVDDKFATPPLTVVKNTIEGVGNIFLDNLDKVLSHVAKQKSY